MLDEVPALFVRGFAWTKLVKYWASLRADDLQWISPDSLTIGPGGLRGQLSRSKTSGPNKKIHSMCIVISNEAWLFDPKWLQIGFDIWKRLHFKRDYLLPCATKDLSGVRRTMATYADMAAYGLALQLNAKFMRWQPGQCKWEVTQEMLFDQGAIPGLWTTEHS